MFSGVHNQLNMRRSREFVLVRITLGSTQFKSTLHELLKDNFRVTERFFLENSWNSRSLLDIKSIKDSSQNSVRIFSKSYTLRGTSDLCWDI